MVSGKFNSKTIFLKIEILVPQPHSVSAEDKLDWLNGLGAALPPEGATTLIFQNFSSSLNSLTQEQDI